MAPPRKRQIRSHLGSRLRIGERITTNPWLAIQRDDVSVRIELGFTLVPQSSFKMLIRVHPRHISRSRHDLDLPTHLLDLHVRDWVEQIFNNVDIFGSNEVASFDLPLRPGIYRQQFVGVRLGDIRGVPDHRP
ncbi:hypothetical protein X551_04618 [Methylibium sp. T29]|nr:hypothetical protein X551_04618 [Methylibium sp. T29]